MVEANVKRSAESETRKVALSLTYLSAGTGRVKGVGWKGHDGKAPLRPSEKAEYEV